MKPRVLGSVILLMALTFVSVAVQLSNSLDKTIDLKFSESYSLFSESASELKDEILEFKPNSEQSKLLKMFNRSEVRLAEVERNFLEQKAVFAELNHYRFPLIKETFLSNKRSFESLLGTNAEFLVSVAKSNKEIMESIDNLVTAYYDLAKNLSRDEIANTMYWIKLSQLITLIEARYKEAGTLTKKDIDRLSGASNFLSKINQGAVSAESLSSVRKFVQLSRSIIEQAQSLSKTKSKMQSFISDFDALAKEFIENPIWFQNFDLVQQAQSSRTLNDELALLISSGSAIAAIVLGILLMKDLSNMTSSSSTTSRDSRQTVNTLNREISQLTSQLEPMREGDLTKAITTPEGSTLGSLTSFLNQIRTKFAATLTTIQEETNEILASTEETSATANQMAKHNTTNLEAIDRTEDLTKKILQKTDKLSEGLSGITNEIRQAGESIKHGSSVVHQNTQAINAVSQTIDFTSEAIREVVTSIDEVDSLSRDITDLNSLLSTVGFNISLLSSGNRISPAEMERMSQEISNTTTDIKRILSLIVDHVQNLKSHGADCSRLLDRTNSEIIAVNDNSQTLNVAFKAIESNNDQVQKDALSLISSVNEVQNGTNTTLDHAYHLRDSANQTTSAIEQTTVATRNQSSNLASVSEKLGQFKC